MEQPACLELKKAPVINVEWLGIISIAIIGVNLGNIYILGIISIMWSDYYSKKLIGWEISGTQNIQ